MSRKDHRAGGKFAGRHTTVIPAAAAMADAAEREPDVTKVLLGIIQAGLRPAHGCRRVKFTDEIGGLLLSVRDNTTHQELRIYTRNSQRTKTQLARYARERGFMIAFS